MECYLGGALTVEQLGGDSAAGIFRAADARGAVAWLARGATSAELPRRARAVRPVAGEKWGLRPSSNSTVLGPLRPRGAGWGVAAARARGG